MLNKIKTALALEYQYAEEEPLMPEKNFLEKIRREELDVLPSELRMELYRAVESGDYYLTLSLVEKVEAFDNELAEKTGKDGEGFFF